MNQLERIIDRTRDDVRSRRKRVPLSELVDRAADRDEPRGFNEALLAGGVGVIAEHKRRSPSAGAIRGSETFVVMKSHNRWLGVPKGVWEEDADPLARGRAARNRAAGKHGGGAFPTLATGEKE